MHYNLKATQSCYYVKLNMKTYTKNNQHLIHPLFILKLITYNSFQIHLNFY